MSIPAQPRTLKEARSRSLRKIKALEKRAHTLLYDIAGYWDEGQVSDAIDEILHLHAAAIDDLKLAIDEEIAREVERDIEE